MRNRPQVIVVGSGAAGLAAAIEAADHGANVIILESEDRVGGSSYLSGGMMMAAGTSYQRAAGVSDSWRELLHEYMLLNQWRVEPGLAMKLAQESAQAIDWVTELGVEFYGQVVHGGEESVPRTHVPVGRGAAVVDALLAECKQRGVQLRTNQRVERLLVESDQVVGVAVDDDELHGSAVVIATGGFGANPARLREYLPSACAETSWTPWYIGADGARGDSIELASDVDARVGGRGGVLTMLTPNFVREYEPYLPGWLMLVNSDGRRFCDETAPYGIMDGLVEEQGNVAYVLFDERARQSAHAGKPAAYKHDIPSSPGRSSPNWTTEMIATMADQGRISRADTIDGIAGTTGIPSNNLSATVSRYNAMVAASYDADYLKHSDFLLPITQPPFYAAELRPATVCLTTVGLAIDTDARVLSMAGDPIAGLYAAGECTGGVIGQRYMGTGNSYINCLVFGRTAGRSASNHTPSYG